MPKIDQKSYDDRTIAVRYRTVIVRSGIVRSSYDDRRPNVIQASLQGTHCRDAACVVAQCHITLCSSGHFQCGFCVQIMHILCVLGTTANAQSKYKMHCCTVPRVTMPWQLRHSDTAQGTRACFNTKTPSCRYGQSHVKENTSYRPSFL